MPSIRYEEAEAVITPGTTVVLHSDGLAEARNGAKEMFGFPRVKSSLQRASAPSAVISQLLDDLASFTGEDWEQDDDITLAVLHRKAETAAPPKSYEDEDGYVLTR
jgi:sigma-B regulation protein RsbU (phosphoserine phosphatase)